MANVRNSKLSFARRNLLTLLREIGFGYIENLLVKQGEPVLEPLPRIMRDVKLKRRDDVGGNWIGDDFVLKEEMIELFVHLERLCDGTVARVEVRHGVPFRILIEGIDE